MAFLRASDLVEAACEALHYDLAKVVALASIWVHPEIYALLEPVRGVWYPERRRANLGLRVNGAPVEKVGDVVDGLTLDNNTYANSAFKIALGVEKTNFVGFHICHIWHNTAYDANCYTNLANLVAVPAELSSLTDHHPHIAACLRFRAWELYGWKPGREMQPAKPDRYPEKWRDPELNEEGRRAALRRVGKAMHALRVDAAPVTRELPPSVPMKTYASGSDVHRQMLEAAFYLSRFEHEHLRLGNQGETIDAIARALGVNRNSLRNTRDTFDSHTGSRRQGWKVPLSSELLAVFRELMPLDEQAVRARVIGAVNRSS